jgi:hypothetical protein
LRLFFGGALKIASHNAQPFAYVIVGMTGKVYAIQKNERIAET